MPHLTFWNRYWRVAGDEFSIPAFCSILARLFWTLLITIVFVITFNTLTQCTAGWVFLVYLLFSILIFVASIMCDTALLLVSLKGSITETEQRSSLGFYLNLKIMLGALQLMCAIFGLISLTAHSEMPCNNSFEQSSLTRAFITVVVVSQLIDVSSMVCCCYMFSANKIDEDHHHQEPKDESWALNTWENRCRRYTRQIQICSCNIFGGSNITEGFDEVAKVLTDFFHHDGFLDVVPSDVVAGIVLVRIEQRTVRRIVSHVEEQGGPASKRNFEISKSVTNPANDQTDHERIANGYHDVDVESGQAGAFDRSFSGITNNKQQPNFNLDLETLECISRCSVFALAIYTHLIVVYMRPCTGICRLCCGASANSCDGGAGKSPCCTCCLTSGDEGRTRGPGTVVEGDNFCGLNYTGLSIITDNLKNTELVYVSFKNDITHKVYAVFLDHEKEQVVIAIRGTLSLEDCITDVICEPAPLDAVGEQWGFDGKGRHAHAGMLKAALGIRAELEANDTLGRIFNGYDSNLKTPLREVRQHNAKASCAHYRLIVTGHSLGAGSAVLLALILRKNYPSLHCYAFGTPGSVLDKRSSREFSSFITTVVMGNDLVCRLSFRTLCKLRNDVLDAISRARVNKMMIMQALFKELDSADLMYPPGQEPDSPFKRSIGAFKTLMRARLEAQQVELSLPGRIIHFAKMSKTKACLGSTSYEMREGDAADFEEILMSTTMGADHLPDVYYYEIKRILNERLRHMTV